MDDESEILSAYPEELHETIKELWDRELIWWSSDAACSKKNLVKGFYVPTHTLIDLIKFLSKNTNDISK